MRLVVFNGSPRTTRGNTCRLLGPLLRGFQASGGHEVTVYYLSRERDVAPLLKAFQRADVVLFAFPLYLDAAPALVLRFFEALEPLAGDRFLPHIGFLIQNGFPEPDHCTYLERYLERWTRRLGAPYAGCIMRSGMEVFRVIPKAFAWSLHRALYALGVSLSLERRFDPQLLRRASTPDYLKGPTGRILQSLVVWGISRGYWNYVMLKHGVYHRRFARPYATPDGEHGRRER